MQKPIIHIIRFSDDKVALCGWTWRTRKQVVQKNGYFVAEATCPDCIARLAR
jgi:hypothetical protein